MGESFPWLISKATYIQPITQIRQQDKLRQQKLLSDSELLNSHIQYLDILIDSRHTWSVGIRTCQGRLGLGLLTGCGKVFTGVPHEKFRMADLSNRQSTTQSSVSTNCYALGHSKVVSHLPHLLLHHARGSTRVELNFFSMYLSCTTVSPSIHTINTSTTNPTSAAY